MTGISLIIPLYNAKDSLADCLAAVKAQTFKDIELILVDDCSTDGSMAEAHRLLMSSGLTWECVSLPANAGPGVARNAGLERASGKYVAFVDADDRIAPTYCEKLYAAAENTGADMVWCGAVEVAHLDAGATREGTDGENAVPRARGMGKSAPGKVLYNKYHEDRGKLLRSMVTYLWTCMFRREFIQAQGLAFPATRCAEDSCFVLGAAMAAGSISTVDEVLYEYTTGAQSLSRRRDRRRACERLKSMRALRLWARERGFATLYRRSLGWLMFKKGWLLALRDLTMG